MHRNSELLFRKYALSYFKSDLKILEIGPAGLPSTYQNIVDNPKIIWETIDFADTTFIDDDPKDLTYKLSNPYEFPIENEVYDIVVSGQVIEHVEKIWIWLRELKRITKPGGHIITINPVSWPYHEAPLDCWRIFPSGIKALADDLDMTVETCVFESLEKDELLLKDPKSKFIPGKSHNSSVTNPNINVLMRYNKIIRRIPTLKRYLEIPIEVAFDTFSVLTK